MKFYPISYELNQTSKLSSKMFPSTSNCSPKFICHCSCCPCYCLCCGCCCDCSCHMESLRQSKEINSNEKKLISNYKQSKSSGNIFLKEDSRKINEDLENFNQELLALKMKLINEKKKKDSQNCSGSTNNTLNNTKFYYYTPKLNKNNNNNNNNNNFDINFNNRQHSHNKSKNFYDINNLNNNDNNTTIPRYKRLSYNFNTNSYNNNNNCNDCVSNNNEFIKRPKKNYSHSKNFSSYDIINYSNNNIKNNNNNNNNNKKFFSNTELISQIKEKTNNLINKLQNQTTRTLIKNSSNFSKKTNYTSNNNSTLNIHKRNNFPFFNGNNNNFNSIPINKNNRNKSYLNSLKDKINHNIYNYNQDGYDNNSNNFNTYSDDFNNNNNKNNENYNNKIQESSFYENSNKKNNINPYNYNYNYSNNNNNDEENPSFKIENNPNLNNNNFFSSSNSFSFPSKIDSFSILIKGSPKIEDNSKDIVIQELKRKIKDLKNKLKNYTNPSSLASSQNDFNNNNNNFFSNNNNNNNENIKIINAQQNEIEQLKNELEQMKQNNFELQHQINLYQKELQTVHNTMSNNSINNNVNKKNNFNDEELIIFPSCKLSILSSYKIINEKQEKYYSFNNNSNININKKISKSSSQKKLNVKIINNNDINLIPMIIKNKKNINLSNELIYKIFTEAKNKNLLCYDLINKFFTLIDFNDFGDFNENFLLSNNKNENNNENNNNNNNNENGSIYLTTNNNFYIITGKNFDKFYKFNPLKKSMDKLCSLNNNHCFGSLISYNNENNIICLSGRFNKKVEIYNISKNSWKELPEMTIERSEFSSCVVNNKLLFACFGLNHPTNVYLDSIEYFDLNYYDNNNNNVWKMLKYKNDMNLNLKIKGNLAINYNNEKIIFIGGVNENKNIENFYQLVFNDDDFVYNNNFNNENDKSFIEAIDRKFKDIKKNKFYLFSNYNCFDYIDDKNYLYNCAFDTKNRLHLIQVSNMLHDIYEIEWKN